MATLNYRIKSKSDFSSIYLRLRSGRSTDLTANTGYFVNHRFWNSTKGTVKMAADFPDALNLSQTLLQLKTHIMSRLMIDDNNGVDVNLRWLENGITNFKTPNSESKKVDNFLINHLDIYKGLLKNKINEQTRKPISQNTIRTIDTSKYRLKNFEEFRNKKLRLEDVNLNFLNEYKAYLTHNHPLAINTISREIKFIKTVCLDARDRGFKIHDQVLSKKFSLPTEKSDFVTLNVKEISIIKKFKGTPHLENARDWLIIGCWTGCRINDLMNLTIKLVKEDENGDRYIRYVQSKTNKVVDVPIHPDVQDILKRLNGFPSKISDQKFNKYIKLVCKELEINELVKGSRQNPTTHLKESGVFEKWMLVRSHICRRSFATNHYNILPNKVIMQVTGHSTEALLLKYIGEIENNHIKNFKEVWKNLKS